MRYITKVLLVDDHKMIIDGLRNLLRPGSGRILEAGNLEDAATLAREEKPDLAIVDFRLGLQTADELIRDIRYYAPATRILMYSFSTAESVVIRSAEAGAHGFIHKGDSPEKILEAVEALMDGRMYFNETARFYLTKLLDAQENHHHVEVAGGITFNDKELKIIKLLSQELSAREISERIFLAEKTVENYKMKIARKMGVKNTPGILAFAFKHGLISQEDL